MGKEKFNDAWTFHKGDLSIERATSDQVSWRPVNVPHDWSVEGPFSSEWASGTGFLPGGIGWYRKDFNLKDYDKNKRYAVYFDGIYKNSEVWINGHYLGKRPNGFIPIQYDLTPFLQADNNLIIVKANHTDYADSRYYTGSGLYRNVYLITQEEHHFSKWGVFFQTPEVSKERATAKVSVELENHGKEISKKTVQIYLKDNDGNSVATSKQDISLRPGKENYLEFDLEINDPKLWSPGSPYLYDLEVNLVEGSTEVDAWNEKVGFRDFHFDADRGFFLNGENMLLKGVCFHHDAGALGAAVPKEVWEKRMETLKELGVNAIRMAHYPHQDFIYELADEMGFLVQEEAFDEWEYGKNKWIEGWNVGTPGNEGYHEAFSEWGVKDVQDMVRRTRNRPSIIMWSIGNEIDYPNDPYSHPVLDEGRNPQIYGKGFNKENPPASHLAKLANELANAVKMYDTTRPVTAALAGVTMSNHTLYPSVLDIVGYNYQEYRYEEDHKEFPERVIYGSENGDALDAWLAVVNNDFISSQFLWTAFDFLGEAREWPVRSSGAGIIDLAGQPKPDFYFRKSLWNNQPMVYIGVANSERDVNRRSNIEEAWIGEEGQTKWITAYTNTEEVELFLNGESLGRKEAVYQNDKMIAWEVPFSPGELLVKGYDKNDSIVSEYKLVTPGTATDLQIQTDKRSSSEGIEEIIHLDILLTDKEGNRITDDDREVSIEVEGPAKLLGLESGDLSSHESYQAKERNTYKGQLRAYIETTGEAKEVNIKISSPGIPEKEISF
ncbi:hypothetical protein APR41_05675 [Salegentibacter salinarum]|uniref:Beta-galactosidase n=2 Tax=Salegentibacter salinarum TaxID=447422 RepID=A0A2N0TSH9_9FLAO|nr:hypothetical protein APR41_05675 [Salegentibacter salinarum]